MRQSTKFYAVLLCAALGFSTSIQSCKDYDDDIDGLQEQIDAVNKSIESLKKDFGALAYVKDVKWDESTRTLTITPATGNPVTYKIADADTKDGNTKYTLTSNKNGNKITITLKGDDSSEQKVEFELPSADSITKDDITLNEQGFICVKGEPTSVQMPQGFDFAKMEVVKENGKLYLKYGDTKKELTAISQFDPAALTFESDDKGNIVVKYLGEPTGQTIKLPETAIVEKEDGSGFIIKIGDKQVEIVNLNILKAELKSLVFIPELYYQGIEAMAANTFFYKPLKLKAVTADGRHADDAPVKSDKELSVTPTLKAQYHLNPSNAAVSKENLSFIFDNKPYTKAGEMEVTIKDAKVENGVLTVFAGLANGTIKDITNDEEVSTLALQAVTASGEKGDTTITSDYAAIKAIALRNFALAEPSIELELSDWHHFTTAKAAIENTDEKHIYQLLWNDEDGIDVAELIQTHVDVDLAMYSALDKDATTDDIKAYGFKYNYELVGYISGDNQTSQSAHAAMKGSRLRAQASVGGKQQAWGAEQNKSTLDKEPLVRVSLVDTTANQVVAVAYLRFRIVEKAEESEDKVLHTAEFTIDSAYTVACTPNIFEHRQSWDQVVDGILSVLNMSKDEFNKEFTLDGATGEGDIQWNATQYTNNTVEAEAIPNTQWFGVAGITNKDIYGTMTEVLTWNIGKAQAYNMFTSGKKEASIIVRFTRTNANGTHSYVYVRLTWAPKVLNVNPEGEILDDASTKIPEVWYKANSKEHGFAEVHLNVSTPTSETSGEGLCEIEKDMVQFFNNEVVLISKVNTEVYKDFTQDKLIKTFSFVNENKEVKGSDGKTYTLTADETGAKLIATEKVSKVSQEIAVLTDNANVATKKTFNSILEYQENDFAKAVLNFADHTDLANTLTAKVQIAAKNGCDQKLTVTNNTFDVKILRPISIKTKNNNGLQDGKDGGDEIKIADILSFTDWRDKVFTNQNNYFKYYQVSALSIEPKDITMEDGRKLLEVYPSAIAKYTPATTLSLTDMGTFSWTNNNNTSHDFKIYMPVKVTYKWGTITVKIPVLVKGTIANN